MNIALIKNGTITKVGTHQECFPNVSFTLDGPDNDFLIANNAKKVGASPAYDRSSQKLVSCTPFLDGELVYTQEVAELSAEEKIVNDAAESGRVRFARNAKLLASDYTQLPDSPVDATAWATYREALRAVPDQEGFPWTVEWPEPPTAIN